MSSLIRDAGAAVRRDSLRRAGPLRRKRQSAGPSSPAPRQLTLASGRQHEPDRGAAQPLRPLIAEFVAVFGSAWRPVTQRKHRDDFARFTIWLEANRLPVTTASLDFMVLVRYVEYLRHRPKVSGVWRGSPDALGRSLRQGPAQTLSLNSVNAYLRPLRSLAIWLVDEGLLGVDPFRRSRRRAALNPLLPAEETPTKSATLADLQALERGCAGNRPLDLRDRAIVSVLVTTAARNSSVRLLRVEDVDFDRSEIRFRRAKGGKTLLIALHEETREALAAYLDGGRSALLGHSAADAGSADDPGWLFLSAGVGEPRPLTMNSLSLMLSRRYHAGGGTLGYFGSHRIRHATATALVNNGMGLEEVSRYLGHSSTDVTRRYAQQTPDSLGHRAADALERAGFAGGPVTSPARQTVAGGGTS
jgi:integrase